MLLVMFNTITVFGEDASEPSISDSNYIYEEKKKHRMFVTTMHLPAD